MSQSGFAAYFAAHFGVACGWKYFKKYTAWFVGPQDTDDIKPPVAFVLFVFFLAGKVETLLSPAARKVYWCCVCTQLLPVF